MKPLPLPVRTGPSWAESGKASVWIAATLAILLAGAAFFGINEASASLGKHREAEAFARNLSVLATSTYASSSDSTGSTPGTELNAGAALAALEPALIALERSDSSGATMAIRASFDQLAAEASAGETAIMTGQSSAADVNAAIAPANQAFLSSVKAGYDQLHANVVLDQRWFSIFTIAVFAISGILMSGLILHSNAQSVSAANARQRQETRFRAMMQHSSDIISLLNAHGDVDVQSSSVLRLLGRSDLWMTGRTFSEIVDGADKAAFSELIQRARSRHGEAVHAQIRLSHGDGSIRLFDVTAADQIDQPEIEGTLLTCKLVTTSSSLQKPLVSPVTLQHPQSGLLTEPFFRDRLQHALTRSTRTADSIALVLLELGPADAIDALSDDARHAVLRTVAGRLMRSIRSGDSIAHLRDLEMAIILEDADFTFAQTVISRVTNQLATPVAHLNGQIQLTARMGMAVKTDPRDNPDTMLLEARAAIHSAQSTNRPLAATATIGVAETELESGMAETPSGPEQPKPKVETFASRAVSGGTTIERMAEIAAEDAASVQTAHSEPAAPTFDQNAFEIQYIPVLALETGEIVELEAQVRWRHPERGFVPVETSGLAHLVAPWALENACRIGQTLPSTRNGGRIRMSVNISHATPIDEALVDSVARILLTSGMDPASLQLEIPVRLVDEGDALSATYLTALQQLRDLGVRLTLDGAGAEADRLPDFARVPVHSVKIDRSVVTLLDRSADRRALVREIVERAQSCNVAIIGTGVETLEQAERLWDLGANEGQGPLFFRPITEDQLHVLFPTHQGLVAAD